jgi:hypothetical protein
MSDKSVTTNSASTPASVFNGGSAAASAPASSVVSANNSSYRLPSDVTLQHASKLAIVEDKPIMLDYWTASVDKKALVGVRESGEKLLVKSAEEYTSPIAKFYKSVTEYIIITENSIYIVSSDIPTRKIS